ncbi:hypothetical protein E2C01_063332 [Portunus trituberculatus]|uniref:Uncharacterized protein n=1 Tax=Portunus trituberculatus TaxID=210409 RepID=A0A5B7HIN7_PORTR|nr:hypothetical protein [Portunus trituberculatus]
MKGKEQPVMVARRGELSTGFKRFEPAPRLPASCRACGKGTGTSVVSVVLVCCLFRGYANVNHVKSTPLSHERINRLMTDCVSVT